MNKLQEIFDAGKPEIISERKRPDGNTMTVVVPFVQADKKNQNGRTYPLALLKKEVSRIQSAVKRHRLIGTGDHPAGGFSDIATSSHILQKVWLDNKGKGYVEMKIIPTPRGKTIQTLINHGAELGVSSRGFGNVSDTGIVQNDYRLMGIDIVQNPSYKQGTFNKNDVFESLDFEKENAEDKMMGLTEKYVEAMIESIYGTQVDEEYFVGSLEEFREKKEALIRAEILVAHKKFETTEQALEHLGEFEEAKRISNTPIPPVQRKVTPADVYYEAKMAGIDPAVYAEKLNKSLEEKETSEEERSIRTEIERAGALSGRAKLVQKEEIYPDGEKRIAYVSERETPQQIAERVKGQIKGQKEIITEDERAEIVAKRTGSTVEFVKEIWAIERKKREKEKKRVAKAQSLFDEEIAAGFGSESRPSARKISKKIIGD